MVDVDTVRLLAADTASPQLFTSDQLQTFLDLEDGNVKLAAAQALDTMASSEVMVSKVITSNGLTTNGAAVGAELRARAKTLRDQADSDALPVVVDNGCPWPPELSAWPVWTWPAEWLVNY
jgi:hypothetical protein